MSNQLVVDLTGSVNASSLANASNLAESNLQHRHHVNYHQPSGTNVVAQDAIVYLAYKATQVLQAWVTPMTAPAAGTTTTVDLQSYVVGTGWVSCLTSTTVIGSTATPAAPIALSLSGTPQLIPSAGTGNASLLRINVTVSGGGAQVQGLAVEVILSENGQ